MFGRRQAGCQNSNFQILATLAVTVAYRNEASKLVVLQNLSEANPSLFFAGFPAKYAVALSNFTIVGGAVANLFFNINRRHSFKPKPLIDWDLILVMEPSTILGAVIGGYLNKVPTCNSQPCARLL